MITQKPTEKELAYWKKLWLQYRDKLTPDRKSGRELLSYLQAHYVLTPEPLGKDVISENVMKNEFFRQKLPAGKFPEPKAYFLENAGEGQKFYQHPDPPGLWGDVQPRIFVAVDLASGCFQVEGSTRLWDELCAFQGLDAMDLQNYVVTACYLLACGIQ